MADKTNIEWTDATWQIVTGCKVVSPGCTNCYAMRLAGTRLRNHPSRKDLTTMTKAGPVWNGMVRFNVGWLLQPLQWKKPRDIFVAAHGDLFHDAVQRWMLVRVFTVMAIAQRHRFQVLTKRPENARAFLLWLQTAEGRAAIEAEAREIGHTFEFEGRSLLALPLPNVWLGVSVEDQKRAQERIPLLLDTPAAVRWISAEPLLGPIDFNALADVDSAWNLNALTGLRENPFGAVVARKTGAKLDWVVAGGESGPNSRSVHPDWLRSLRDQCASAGTQFFFKQWGSTAAIDGAPRIIESGGSDTPDVAWPDGTIAYGTAEQHGGPGMKLARVGKKAAGAKLDGVEHREMPR